MPRMIDADKLIDDYNKSNGTISDLMELILDAAEEAKPPNDPLTPKELREMDKPVWVECGATPFTPNGGYYCLCQFGKITTPSGSQFDIEEISYWKFYDRKPEEGTA